MISTDPQTISALTRLTGARSVFDRVATNLVWQMRTAMSVPPRADPDVEAEFRVLRAHFDQFLPEFQDMYARLLIRHLGAEHLPEVLAALETAAAQRYLEAAGRIDVAMRPLLGPLAERMLLLARGAE